MKYIDIADYVLALPITLIEAFGGLLVIVAAILGIVGLWLCRALFSGMKDSR